MFSEALETSTLGIEPTKVDNYGSLRNCIQGLKPLPPSDFPSLLAYMQKASVRSMDEKLEKILLAQSIRSWV